MPGSTYTCFSKLDRCGRCLSFWRFCVSLIYSDLSSRKQVPRCYRYQLFHLSTLPKNGTLYFSEADGSRGDATVSVPVDVEDRADSFPNLWYQSTEGFFTRLGSSTYGRFGVGWKGCPLAVAPGCPDSFLFTINGSDVEANYTIEVENVFESIPEPEYTDKTTIVVVTGLTATTRIPLKILDNDGDSYQIALRLGTTVGAVISANLSTLEITDTSKWTFNCQDPRTLGAILSLSWDMPALSERTSRQDAGLW